MYRERESLESRREEIRHLTRLQIAHLCLIHVKPVDGQVVQMWFICLPACYHAIRLKCSGNPRLCKRNHLFPGVR